MSKETSYGFYALYIGCKYKSLDGKTPDGYISGFSFDKETGMEFADISFTEGGESGEEVHIPTNCFDDMLIKLRPFESLTEDEWIEIWSRIGGAPHLYEYGIDELKQVLNGEIPDQCGLQLDYFTLAQLFNYLRSIEIDCDGLIEAGYAIDKTLTNE